MIALASPMISVVVPCYNEEEVLPETNRRLVETLSTLGLAFEILYVDDGSADATAQILYSLRAQDDRIRVLQFSRNFGHQTAVSAGIDHARGDAVVLIDADLQDPPEVIQQMVSLWREGYHVVYGHRQERAGESAFKLQTAKLFYRLLNLISDVPIPLDTGDFRLMDRKVVAALSRMPERDRFLRGMVSWVGYRQTAVQYRRAARFAGTSKYPLWKMFRFAVDGLISFSLVPLRFASILGMSASALALLGIVYALIARLFTSYWVTGWTLLFIGVLFMGGIQMITLGILGEYVGRIYREGKRRPLYLTMEPSATDDEQPSQETSGFLTPNRRESFSTATSEF